MKKLVLLGAVGFLFAFSACKKEYTCECTSTAAGVSATSSTTIKDTKKNAEEACETGSASSSVGGLTASASCTLK